MEDHAQAAGSPLTGNDPSRVFDVGDEIEEAIVGGDGVAKAYVRIIPEIASFVQRNGYLTRIRLEAQGCSAAEVEAALVIAACAIDERLGLESGFGEQFIQREVGEPEGDTAFSGRLLVHPNVARDAAQHDRLRELREADFQPIRPPYVAGLEDAG